MNKKTLRITRAAIIAAVYAVTTLVLFPISTGPIQFRVSEALTILPLFFPEAIVGLTVGCLIANLISTPFDILLGTAATLIASILSYVIGRLIKREPLRVALGILPPIIINMIMVPIAFALNAETFDLYWINLLTVGLGQLGVLLVLGTPFYFGIKKMRQYNQFLL